MDKNATKKSTWLNSEKVTSMAIQAKNIHEYYLLSLIALFILSFFIYFSIPNTVLPSLDFFYIQMAILLFAVVSGFIISRQGARYRKIMEEIAAFDGGITALFREFFYFGKKYQTEFETIARNHYEPIIANHSWDFNLVNKSQTLGKTYFLLEKACQDQDFQLSDSSSLFNCKRILAELQKSRKNMLLLHSERMPRFQWFVVTFLGFILLITLTSIPSFGHYVESLIKASFVTAIITTMIMLYRLDNLKLFESYLGERSAQDIIRVLEEKN